MILFIFPVIGALIGSSVAFLCITYLIRPKKPISLGIYDLEGIIPKYRKQWVEMLSSLFVKTIDVQGEVSGKIDEAGLTKEIDGLLDYHMDNLIATLKKQIPMGGMFLTETLTIKLKKLAGDEIWLMLPELKKRLIERTSKNLDIKEYLKAKIHQIDEEKVKEVFLPALEAEKWILLFLGGGIGFFLALLFSLLMAFFSMI